jgi:hypothetical protein
MTAIAMIDHMAGDASIFSALEAVGGGGIRDDDADDGSEPALIDDLDQVLKGSAGAGKQHGELNWRFHGAVPVGGYR